MEFSGAIDDGTVKRVPGEPEAANGKTSMSDEGRLVGNTFAGGL